MIAEMGYMVYTIYSIDKQITKMERDMKLIKAIMVQHAPMRETIQEAPSAVFLADSEDGWEYGERANPGRLWI